MPALEILKEKIKCTEDDIRFLQRDVTEMEASINTKRSRIEALNNLSYDMRLKELHILEIYRLAKKHLPRLEGHSNNELTNSDIAEIEKWIGRAKDTDGLKSIVDAFNELQKYTPGDIKSNLYALAQRIIIGGAFHQKGSSK